MKTFMLDTELTDKLENGGVLRTIQISRGPVGYLFDVFDKSLYKFRIDPDDSTIESIEIEGKKTFTDDQLIKILKENNFVTQNGYFDHYVILRDLKLSISLKDDTYLFAVMSPQSNPNISLEGLMKQYVNKNYNKAKYGAWKDFIWTQELCRNQLFYAMRDAFALEPLRNSLKDKFPNLDGENYQMELELIPTLSKMRYRGILYNRQSMITELNQIVKEAEQIESKLSKLRGSVVKVNSPKNLATWIFSERGNKPLQLTGSGQPSTATEVLEQLNDPVISAVLEAKSKYSLAKSLKPLAQKGKADNTVISDIWSVAHPVFKPPANSVRLYASGGISNLTWRGRDYVKPRKGRKYFFFDFKAFEFFFLSFKAGEKQLVDCYLNGGDIYLKASEIAYKTNKDREIVKKVVLATLFGSEGLSVSRDLGISESEAKDRVRTFLRAFPNLAEFLDSLKTKCLKDGYAETFTGRRRYLLFETPDKKERIACNYYSQSGVSEIVKRFLIWLDKNLPKGSYPLFSVYDSVLIEAKLEISKDQLVSVIKKMVTEVYGIPFRFDASESTRSWLDAKENMEESF